jgi:glycosyltransferase involved in cell wall biosynthesis
MTPAPTRVAAFTPGPPHRSGGAVYAGALLPVLAEHLDVVAVSPDPFEWGGPSMHPDNVDAADFDVLVHFLADSRDHLFAYRSAVSLGGVVVCHDLMLPHLLGTFSPDDEAADLAASLGEERASELLGRRARRISTHHELYMVQVVSRAVRGADAAIVHSRFAKFALECEVPGLPVHHVPSHAGAVPADLDPPGVLRAALGLPRDAFLVGMFGYLGGHKRIAQSLDGIAAAIPLARRMGSEIGLVMVGAEVGTDLHGMLGARGLAGIATVRGAVDDRSFFEHMAAVDVLVALRYPTLGESSATIVQAMRLGKPVITTDHAQFGEERAAVRIAPDAGEVDRIADALVSLATCGRCRSVASEQSATRAARFTIEAASAGYVAAIEAARWRGRPPGPRNGACIV